MNFTVLKSVYSSVRTANNYYVSIVLNFVQFAKITVALNVWINAKTAIMNFILAKTAKLTQYAAVITNHVQSCSA